MQAGQLGLQAGMSQSGNIDAAVERINHLNNFTTNLEKMECLSGALAALTTMSDKSMVVSADDLVPLMCLMIIRSEIPNWKANHFLMANMQFTSLSSPEQAYHLTSLEAAIEHISTNNLAQEAPWRARTVSTSDGSGAAQGSSIGSTAAFFNAVADQQLALLTDMLRAVPADLTSRADTSSPGLYSKSPSEETAAVSTLCHPLCECARCQTLVRSKRADSSAVTVYTRDADGFTALHVAARIGHSNVVSLLVDVGAIVDAADYNERTALHLACQRDQVDCVLLLLMHGADINAADCDGNTPLHMCASNGHDRCAKVVMWHAPQILRINARNTRGDTPLHLASTWGYSSIVEMLLLHGARHDLRNKRNQTAIHCAHSKVVVDAIHLALESVGTDSARVTLPPSHLGPRRRTSSSPNSVETSPSSPSPNASSRKDTPTQRSSPLTKMATGSSRERSKSRPAKVLSGLQLQQNHKRDVQQLFEAIEEGDTELISFKLGFLEDGQTNKYTQAKCHPLCQVRVFRPSR